MISSAHRRNPVAAVAKPEASPRNITGLTRPQIGTSVATWAIDGKGLLAAELLWPSLWRSRCR